MTDPHTLTLHLHGHWHGHYGTAACPICQREGLKNQNALTISSEGGKLLLHCKKNGCAFSDLIQTLGEQPVENSLNVVNSSHRSGAENSQRAQALWERAIPIQGSHAEAYLRARSISCDLPETLRYLPDCRHPNGETFPALIARIDGGQGFAVHRTYLARYRADKANATPQKAMLGKASGGAVRLSECAGPLLVAEGVETALSLLSGVLGGPATVWAALSTSGMRGLSLPAKPGDLVIAPDNDAPGRSAAFDLASRATALGWHVSSFSPPDGLDWNDVLTGKAGAA